MPHFAGRVRARELPHVADGGVDPGIGLGVVELGDVGTGILVVLVPFHARTHGQQLADRNVVIGRTFEIGDVRAHFVVEALDGAVVDRRADQGRGEGLRDREARPAAGRVEPETVTLEAHLAVLHDNEARFALVRHVGVDVGDRQRLPRGERRRRRRREDGAGAGQKRQPVESAKGGVALVLPPAQDVGVGRQDSEQAPGFLIEAGVECAARERDSRQRRQRDHTFTHPSQPSSLFFAADCPV